MLVATEHAVWQSVIFVQRGQLLIYFTAIHRVTTNQPPDGRDLECHRVVYAMSLHGRFRRQPIGLQTELFARLLGRVPEIRELRFPVVALLMQKLPKLEKSCVTGT